VAHDPEEDPDLAATVDAGRVVGVRAEPADAHVCTGALIGGQRSFHGSMPERLTSAAIPREPTTRRRSTVAAQDRDLLPDRDATVTPALVTRQSSRSTSPGATSLHPLIYLNNPSLFHDLGSIATYADRPA